MTRPPRLQGPADQVSDFIAYVKREISRRWGGNPKVEWSDSMWSPRYLATALPTAESQMTCLRYILSQGVKEGLVAKPQLWPGVHCAQSLLSGRKLAGVWLDSTAWKRACYEADRRRKPSAKPAPIRKADFEHHYEVELTPIPAWKHLTEEQRRARVRRMANEIEEEGRIARNGRKPLGVRAVCSVPLNRRSALEPPPWFENRRRMICWADRNAPETKAYVARYWKFQMAYRAASAALRCGELTAVFPASAFRPVTFHRATAPPS